MRAFHNGTVSVEGEQEQKNMKENVMTRELRAAGLNNSGFMDV